MVIVVTPDLDDQVKISCRTSTLLSYTQGFHPVFFVTVRIE